ncbi:hypothetical protein GGR51DRAFT_307396 [Nemania sp. FL0031]|nr:hypothetical protein GGR51DRAFT_307396 [Nemania sp. FL0031]
MSRDIGSVASVAKHSLAFEGDSWIACNYFPCHVRLLFVERLLRKSLVLTVLKYILKSVLQQTVFVSVKLR